MSIVLVLCMGLVAAIFSKLDAADERNQKFKVGVVGDTTDTYINLGLYALQNLDSSKYILDFETLSEEEAKEKLMAGKLSAYIVIPQGFVSSVYTGENQKISYVTSQGSVDISTLLIGELMDIISNMITNSQAAGSGLYNYMKEYAPWVEQSFYETKLDEEIFTRLLGRGDLFEVKTLGVENGLSMAEYYICGLLLFFLMLWGINLSFLMVKDRGSVQKLFLSRGLSLHGQVAGELMANVFFLYGTFCILAVLGEILVWKFPKLGEAVKVNPVIFILTLFPIIFLATSFQFFLYECSKNMISAVLLQFLTALVLAFLSGCFYPISFFPESVQRISKILPSTIALSYESNQLLLLQKKVGKVDWNGLWICIGYGLICYAGSILVRKKILQKE